MIEREPGQLVEREPAHAHRIGGGPDAVIGELRERVVRDGDHALARIAIDRSERVELLEVDLGHARLLLELAARCLVEGLVDPDEPAGQRPGVQERRDLALDEQHLEARVIEPEHDAIDRDRRARVIVRVLGHCAAM